MSIFFRYGSLGHYPDFSAEDALVAEEADTVFSVQACFASFWVTTARRSTGFIDLVCNLTPTGSGNPVSVTFGCSDTWQVSVVAYTEWLKSVFPGGVLFSNFEFEHPDHGNLMGIRVAWSSVSPLRLVYTALCFARFAAYEFTAYIKEPARSLPLSPRELLQEVFRAGLIYAPLHLPFVDESAAYDYYGLSGGARPPISEEFGRLLHDFVEATFPTRNWGDTPMTAVAQSSSGISASAEFIPFYKEWKKR